MSLPDKLLEPVLLDLVAPHTAGNPMRERKWLNCRLADFEEKLDAQGHGVSRPVISRLLRAQAYDLHVTVKEVEGADHPDRDTQFQYIQEQSEQHRVADHACLSVDTKKKELIGNFKNAGQSWGTQPPEASKTKSPPRCLTWKRRGEDAMIHSRFLCPA